MIRFINKVTQGDCIELMKQIPENSVDCIVTSPPYYGLRDYGVPGQIGLEDSPVEYIAKMVEVFTECYRILKPTGTCWLNLGDSYVTNTLSGGGGKNAASRGDKGYNRKPKSFNGLKPKQLMGMPWRVAFALQDAGWYLRQDIIWSKKNCMPESVKDRCTKSHEYIFLLTKSDKYFFDAKTISEPVISTKGNAASFRGDGAYVRLQSFDNSTPATRGTSGNVFNVDGTRNKRSVWEMATQTAAVNHFATFPEKLPETCILAGCPEGGITLDPFSGSGTTGKVAKRLGRKFILLELNPDYVDMGNTGIRNVPVSLF